MLSLLRLGYVMALRRTISSWRLELVLFLGITLAVALLSSGLVFSDLLAEVALRRTLEEAKAEEVDFSLRTYSSLGTPMSVAERAEAHQQGLAFVQRGVGGRVGSHLRDQAYLLETSTFYFEGHAHLELSNTDRPRGAIKYVDTLWPGRVEMVQGRWPYASSGAALSGGSPPVDGLEVAIDALGAELLQLDVGDRMMVFPASSSAEPPRLPVKVVGIFQRLDPSDSFWQASDQDFSFQNERWTMVPLFTTEEAILKGLLPVYPGLYTDVTWNFYLDRQSVRAGQVGELRNAIAGMRQDVRTNLANSHVFIRLDRVLESFQQQMLLARVPLFLMLFLVTGILVYYLALIAGLVVRSRATEVAMLKSRGATTWQVGLLTLVEGLLLAVPAVVVGPLLALAVTRALGGVFFDLGSNAEPVPVALSGQAFLLGLGGAVLAVAVLTVATLVAARQGIVEFRQAGARPPRTPFFHRYYLDIMLLAFIGLIWWQIQGQGAFLVRPLGSGDAEIEPALLLGPALALLALGLLVMRFFPLLLALQARAIEGIGPAWLVHGLRRAARDPIVPGSLVVLLMLATALGVVGSTFRSTLERSQAEQALYEAGADLRVLHLGGRTPQSLLGLAKQVEDSEAVLAASEVQRTSGSLLTRGLRVTSASVLAVDTERFSSTAWYRPDFSSRQSLGELVQAIAPQENASMPGGIALPEDATALSLWAHPARPDNRVNLEARLQDSLGRYFDVPFGDLGFREWRRLEASLEPAELQARSARGLPPEELVPPYTLIAFHTGGQFGLREPGALFLDQLSAVTTAGAVPLSDFQPQQGWQSIEDYYRPGLYSLDTSRSLTRPGRAQSALFSWSPGGTGLRGLQAGGPDGPLPAVVSRSLLEAADAKLGDTVTLGLTTYALPVRAVAVADYFPTLEPEAQPFVIVDLETFNQQAIRHSPRLTGGSNELWVRLADGTAGPQVVETALEDLGIAVRESYLSEQLVEQRVQQPLVNAGWGGLLVLMFLALLLASASGVLLFSYVDLRERQTEFALLRTLGSSRWQLHGLVCLNLLLVMAWGIGLGTWAGHQVGASLLPLLEIAEEGTRVTPPMTLQTGWTALVVSYSALAAVALVMVGWLAWFVVRLEVHRMLRIGEA